MEKMESIEDKEQTLVMLIDDSIMDIFINTKILESFKNKASILEFNIGTKAIDYLIAHKNEPEKIPEIIFLDIYMPYMSGFEFLEEYEKLPISVKSKISVFMLSSSLDPDDLKQVEENVNVERMFNKPLTRQIVEEVAHITNGCYNY